MEGRPMVRRGNGEPVDLVSLLRRPGIWHEACPVVARADPDKIVGTGVRGRDPRAAGR